MITKNQTRLLENLLEAKKQHDESVRFSKCKSFRFTCMPWSENSCSPELNSIANDYFGEGFSAKIREQVKELARTTAIHIDKLMDKIREKQHG